MSDEIKMSLQQPNRKNKAPCFVKIPSGEGITVHMCDLFRTLKREFLVSLLEIISIVKCQALLWISLIQLFREGFLLGKISLSSPKALKRHPLAFGKDLSFSIITFGNRREGTLIHLIHCHIQIVKKEASQQV